MKEQISVRLEAIQARHLVAPALLFAAGAARAEGIDVTAAVSTIGTGAAAIAALGIAYLGLTVLKKLWRKLGG